MDFPMGDIECDKYPKRNQASFTHPHSPVFIYLTIEPAILGGLYDKSVLRLLSLRVEELYVEQSRARHTEMLRGNTMTHLTLLTLHL